MLNTYKQLKQEDPKTILLFQVNDQYQSFNTDAKTIEKEFNLSTITYVKDGIQVSIINHNELSLKVKQLNSKGYAVSIVTPEKVINL